MAAMVNATLKPAMGLLKERMREIQSLESLDNLLSWDQQVFMPPGGMRAHEEQVQTLALVLHGRRTDPKLGNCLDELMAIVGPTDNENTAELGLSKMEIASVRLAARDFARSKRIPAELQKRVAYLSAAGTDAWSRARKASDFQVFAPLLEQWIQALKEEAAAVEPEMSVYDYCLDKHERGLSVEKVDAMFSEIKAPLISLLKRIGSKQKSLKNPQELFAGLQFPLDAQRALSKKVAGDMGFDWINGRLDESGHPMTINIFSPGDVRLTTRYAEDDVVTGLLATIHEAGHGLYEQGRDLEACNEGLVASRPISMGLHESQSLLWERMVGLSKEFWVQYWPLMLESFPCLPRERTPQEFHRLVNAVEFSLIRVDADEVSYPLHVLLRYEIEKGLFDGSLSVQDIPRVWNEKMEEYLGLRPGNDAEGCLQDIHWGMGAFGYFPTYVMGAVYACQIFNAAKAVIPNLLVKENFGMLREWLRENVHSAGSIYETADDLVEHVTGSKLDAAGFLRHLTAKYTAIYEL